MKAIVNYKIDNVLQGLEKYILHHATFDVYQSGWDAKNIFIIDFILENSSRNVENLDRNHKHFAFGCSILKIEK